jgi:hypothetical protein
VRARAWYGSIAVVLVLALAVQVIVAIHAPSTPPGHGVGQLRGGPPLTRVVLVNALLVGVVFVLVGALYALGDRKLPAPTIVKSLVRGRPIR